MHEPRSQPTESQWAAIQLFAMDVDGVLTDGTVFVGANGFELKQFSILDGLGLKRLEAAGVLVAWISGRASPATISRATELGVPHVIQGRTDKLPALQELAGKLGLDRSVIAYMGDDDIDVPAIRWAGIGISVPQAFAAVQAEASYVTHIAAGRGAVREICDLLLKARAANKRT